MSEHSNRVASDTPHSPETDGSSAGATVIDGHGLITALVDASIIQEDEALADHRLTDEFSENWWSRIEQFRDTDRARDRLATVAGIESTELRIKRANDGRFVAVHEGVELSEWPSKAAFIADLALQPTIEESFPLWSRIDPISRGELLVRIRAFLESCPVCEHPLELTEQVTAETEGSEVTLACTECGQTLVTARTE